MALCKAQDNATHDTASDTLPSTTKPSLRDTINGLQTRFFCRGPSALMTLKLWRAALHTRYIRALRDTGAAHVIWRDTDAYDDDIPCDDSYLDCSTPDLPKDLGETFVQVWRGKAKLITVTLFYHSRSRATGGSCLIQGYEKDSWVHTEFEALCTHVEH